MTLKYLILDEIFHTKSKKRIRTAKLTVSCSFSIFVTFDYTSYLKNNFEFITKIKAFFIKI